MGVTWGVSFLRGGGVSTALDITVQEWSPLLDNQRKLNHRLGFILSATFLVFCDMKIYSVSCALITFHWTRKVQLGLKVLD